MVYTPAWITLILTIIIEHFRSVTAFVFQAKTDPFKKEPSKKEAEDKSTPSKSSDKRNSTGLKWTNKWVREMAEKLSKFGLKAHLTSCSPHTQSTAILQKGGQEIR